MSTTDTSGPAFPTQQERGPQADVIEWSQPGMTLRDYFAAKALQGLLAGEVARDLCLLEAEGNDEECMRPIVSVAYSAADVMLERRELPRRSPK